MKKYVFLLVCGITLYSCAPSQLTVQVPAGTSVEVDYPAYAAYEAQVRNASGNELQVGVLSKDTDEQIRGFGLNGRSNARVMVGQGSKLVLRNSSAEAGKVKIGITEKDVSIMQAPDGYVSFTLQNKSAKSIPLIIPEVMNPNLSPFSKSGVNLKPGQEILFREKGRKYLLLTVDNSIATGTSIDVARLLKERKAELGL